MKKIMKNNLSKSLFLFFLASGMDKWFSAQYQLILIFGFLYQTYYTGKTMSF